MANITNSIKSYILNEFLPGEDPSLLTDEVELVTGGILDSLATLRLVAFLEKTFGIQIEAHETGVDYLNTIADITDLVNAKKQVT